MFLYFEGRHISSFRDVDMAGKLQAVVLQLKDIRSVAVQELVIRSDYDDICARLRKELGETHSGWDIVDRALDEVEFSARAVITTYADERFASELTVQEVHSALYTAHCLFHPGQRITTTCHCSGWNNGGSAGPARPYEPYATGF